MSSYLARLKEVERKKTPNNSLTIELPEIPFGTFDTTTNAHFFRKNYLSIGEDKEKNISLSRTEQVSKVSKDASCTNVQSKKQINIALIQSWLFKIEEPEEYHQIVLDKCKNDPEALSYFLKHVNGEF